MEEIFDGTPTGGAPIHQESSTITNNASDDVALLFDTAWRVSKLGNPLHVNSTRARTYGGITNDPGYVLSTVRGERNVGGITRQTDVNTDELLEELLRFVDERAFNELCERHPDLTKPGASALLTDKKTPVPAMNMVCQQSGEYDLAADLSFNLTPKRSRFLRHFYNFEPDTEDECGDNPPIEKVLYRQKLDAIGAALDAQCSRVEGCVYTSFFFPETSQYFRSGPIAYGKYKEELTTEIPHLLRSQKDYVEYIDLLYRLFLDDTVKAQTLCICCILVDQAANQFCASSGGPAHGDNMRRGDVFLLGRRDMNRKCDTPPVREISNESDYFEHLINVNGCSVFQLAEQISMRDYEMKREGDEWVVLHKS